MLGLLLLYYVGKPFYELADRHGKSKWGFAILGVVMYYVGTFLAGFFIVIAADLMGINVNFVDENDLLLSVLALPFGLFAAWVTYKFIARSWSTKQRSDDAMLDADLFGDGKF